MDLWQGLYNFQWELLKSVQTKLGNLPGDIAVTQSRDLVYTNSEDKTVHIVKKTEIQPLIRITGWIPFNLCSTTSEDLFVRYSCSTEKRNLFIQNLTDKHKFITYIQEKLNWNVAQKSDHYPRRVWIAIIFGMCMEA